MVWIRFNFLFALLLMFVCLFMSGIYLFELIIKYSLFEKHHLLFIPQNGFPKEAKMFVFFCCCCNEIISVNYCRCDMCLDL